jgi:hypothetical protein
MEDFFCRIDVVYYKLCRREAEVTSSTSKSLTRGHADRYCLQQLIASRSDDRKLSALVKTLNIRMSGVTNIARVLAVVILCMFCAPSTAADDDSAKFLPLSPEPASTASGYKDLPQELTFTVRMSSQDVIELVQSRFAGKFNPKSARFSLHSEDLVLSAGAYYRRVGVYFSERPSIRGQCGQWVSVWFSPMGEEKGIYVRSIMCVKL